MGEGSGREIEMAVRLCTPPATSGILPAKYAELAKRCVSRLTWIAHLDRAPRAALSRPHE
jgi:hypothetical protein